MLVLIRVFVALFTFAFMKNKYLFLISFVVFLITMAGMLYTEKLATCGEKIIIPLELAPSAIAFKNLLISSCNLDWIERNTQLDFLFILTYTATIFFALKGLTESSIWLKSKQKYLWLVILPGVLDAIENVHLIKFLRLDISQISDASYSTYSWCVHVKFVLLIVLVLTIGALSVKEIYQRVASR